MPRVLEGFERRVAIEKPAKPTRAAYVLDTRFFAGVLRPELGPAVACLLTTKCDAISEKFGTTKRLSLATVVGPEPGRYDLLGTGEEFDPRAAASRLPGARDESA